MKFNSTHNGEIICLEYDELEAMQDGIVGQITVTFKGVDVTGLLEGEYGAFWSECSQHYAKCRIADLEAV